MSAVRVTQHLAASCSESVLDAAMPCVIRTKPHSPCNTHAKYPKIRPATYNATDSAAHDSFDTPSIRSQRCTGNPLPRRAHACIPSACEPAPTLLLMLSTHCSSHSQLREPLKSLTGCKHPQASPQRPRQTCTHSTTDLRHPKHPQRFNASPQTNGSLHFFS